MRLENFQPGRLEPRKSAMQQYIVLFLYEVCKERTRSYGVLLYELELKAACQRISIYSSRKEFSMSPIITVVVLILAVLFIVLSILPLLPGQEDMDSSKPTPRAKTKHAR